MQEKKANPAFSIINHLNGAAANQNINISRSDVGLGTIGCWGNTVSVSGSSMLVALTQDEAQSKAGLSVPNLMPNVHRSLRGL
jgi:hypothetical protein